MSVPYSYSTSPDCLSLLGSTLLFNNHMCMLFTQINLNTSINLTVHYQRYIRPKKKKTTKDICQTGLIYATYTIELPDNSGSTEQTKHYSSLDCLEIPDPICHSYKTNLARDTKWKDTLSVVYCFSGGWMMKKSLKAKSGDTERVLLLKNPVFYLLQYGLAVINEA